MSSTRGRHLLCAEQHLGDHLAAFVDGELQDDARDRVLAHLATCTECKDAADEQRRMKDAIAASAPPTLSAGLLARLQELPAGDGDATGGPFDGGGMIQAAGLGGERLNGDLFGKAREEFALPLSASSSRGFRIHETARPSTPAAPGPTGSAGRGRRRFAFAAAGAFSMAAIALGGALPLDGAPEPGMDETGAAVTPLSSQQSARPAADVWARPTGDLLHPSSGTRPFALTSPTAGGRIDPAAVARSLLAPDRRASASPSASGTAVPATLAVPAPGTSATASPRPGGSAPASPSASVPVASTTPLLGTFPVSR
ncbi:zf-HC2 domain-containing protein [Streptomyces sp. MI02-7b]|uniref:zf-HC2 domain-containing protein n=1 Tax=Streptomyces sp. MI02-7b TaxID=462941 RepID=UPI0029A9DBFB|nr:zf-HC2 domain-containing protein [Streptomyces sp. MI02-7b]MDX3078143.1 zf-HC2 domain-containing protein [Streptomyces sp. MI02-7b]